MKKWIFLFLVFATLLYGFNLSDIKDFFSEDNLINLLKEYGYIILFIWSIMEGETGLVMAGILSHTGDMNLWVAIVVAALGGFIGDQIYYYLGRFNKNWVLKELNAHRRKFAKARLLLRKYGGWVIFIQRFIYGMRTIIPMTIGVLGYDPKKYAIINFISAFVWASVTIIPSYIFGEQLLEFLKWLKQHWYFGIMFLAVVWGILWYINKKEES
ncbi:DedA family protein [Caminibacter pacificus]|uniref:DedA family protein n=1 Tax=Caminibacter pacificus TaxID=1424653 RepID=A0AAJ4RDJ1_9BACT|nr:DedA family protein [Caminibacter pacificus]NPA87898.1 DedA family protein [Campylobacterota bacterium]QCI28404.1 DedA family protein [Caminibacter pacificus]ROR40872.1 membrane protein DedA with SNARE-associated domain [Caminibacter pacificus]